MTDEIMSLVSEQTFAVWFLIGAALVFWMQAGFAMVETGFTRAKNAGNILMKNLMDFCIGTVVFILIGFSLLLGEDLIGFIGKPGLISLLLMENLIIRVLYSILYSAPQRQQLFPVPWQKEQNLSLTVYILQ